MENFDYEKMLLDWKRNLMGLREKYKDTPAGFLDEEQKRAAAKQLAQEIQQYENSHVYRLAESYRPKEEWFFGRENCLKELGAAMKQGPVVLYGIGGVGKSAIAREFARRNQGSYDKILCLSCEKGIQQAVCDDMQVKISNLRYSYEKYGGKRRYYREKIKKLEEISRKIHLLLILDNLNVQQDARIQEVLTLPCDVLITTRIQSPAWEECQKIYVRGFSIREQKSLIEACQKKFSFSAKTQEELLYYGAQMQGHPLRIFLKIRDAAKGKTYGKSSEDFTGDLFSGLPLKNSGKQILRELSVMPASGIPLDLYLRISKADETEIHKLESYLLVNLRDGILSLSPVVAEAARKTFRPSIVNCRKLVWGIYECVYDAWLKPFSQNQQMEKYVLAILENFSRPRGWMMRPLEGMVTFLWIQEYYWEAEKYAHKLMRSVEREYGPAHQNTGEMALRVAAVYHNSLNFEPSWEWYVRGYEILRNCVPVNTAYYHIFARACEKMGRMSRWKGDYLKALEYEEEAYQSEVRFEQESGGRAFYHEEDSAVSKRGSQLEKVKTLLAMGEFKEASKAYQEIDLSVFDHNESDTGSWVYEMDYRICEFEGVWAEILFRNGRYKCAEEFSKKVLERTCKYRGNYFKDALIAREQLADICQAQGKQAEAAREYEIVLEGLTKEHPYRKEWIQRILDKINEE